MSTKFRNHSNNIYKVGLANWEMSIFFLVLIQIGQIRLPPVPCRCITITGTLWMQYLVIGLELAVATPLDIEWDVIGGSRTTSEW